jgi:hypothetical protein
MWDGLRKLTVTCRLSVFKETIGQRHAISYHLKVAADRRPSSFGAVKSAVF